jgi:hypothetical protein
MNLTTVCVWHASQRRQILSRIQAWLLDNLLMSMNSGLPIRENVSDRLRTREINDSGSNFQCSLQKLFEPS